MLRNKQSFIHFIKLVQIFNFSDSDLPQFLPWYRVVGSTKVMCTDRFLFEIFKILFHIKNIMDINNLTLVPKN